MDTYWKLAFKQALKQRKMTMPALAEAVGLSLPGLKKVFQRKDISLERFRSFCQVLELNPAELIGREMQEGMKVKKLSAAADAFLAKEHRAFYLYWHLAVEKLSLSQAAEEQKMSRAEAYRYLGKLDHYGLLKWKTGDEIVVPESTPFLFDSTSVSAMKFARAQGLKLVDQSFDHPKTNSALMMRYLTLTQEELDSISLKLKDEVSRLLRNRSYKGRTLTTAKRQRAVRVLLCIRAGEFD